MELRHAGVGHEALLGRLHADFLRQRFQRAGDPGNRRLLAGL